MPTGNWARGAQGRLIGEIHGQDTVNVWHFGTDLVADDEGELNTILLGLATAIRDCVIEFLLPAVTADWRFVRADAKLIYPTPGDPIIASPIGNNVGQLGPASHSFAASLMQIRTGGGGRSGQGRSYLPPPGESNTANSLIDEPTLVLLAAFTACVGAKFMGSSPESNWNIGVLSQKLLNNTPGNFNQAFRVAASINLSQEAAIMSSRRRGNGG